MTLITSVQNNTIKNIKKLQKAKERKKQQKFIIEGAHLVEMAHESKWPIDLILATDDYILPESLVDCPLERITSNVLAHLTETKTPQGIVAVLNKQEIAFPVDAKRVLVCDNVQDPGNLGTMIRTADAAGFDAVICGAGTADLYNDKTIRSTQGSLFNLPVMTADLHVQLTELKANGFHIWAAALQDSVAYNEAEKADKLAIIVGNEGSGIQESLIEIADQIVKIPIFGKAESLNVSIAAGILMYEAKK